MAGRGRGKSMGRTLGGIVGHLRLGPALACAAFVVLVVPASALGATGPAALVDPFVGTDDGAPNYGTGGGGGNTFPGATLPFGMLGWSPDTIPAQRNTPAGYSWDDERMRGFSLKHASGAGCAIYQDVSFMPTSERLQRFAGQARRQRHHQPLPGALLPQARGRRPGLLPGATRLRGGGSTSVALTSTTRAGIARIRFPRRGNPLLLINAGASASGNAAAAVQIDPGAARDHRLGDQRRILRKPEHLHAALRRPVRSRLEVIRHVASRQAEPEVAFDRRRRRPGGGVDARSSRRAARARRRRPGPMPTSGAVERSKYASGSRS